MKVDHSSLLTDTGLSEIELDRLGIKPVEREEYDPEISEVICKLSKYGSMANNKNRSIIAQLGSTYYPFKDKPWYLDEDVITLLEYVNLNPSRGFLPSIKRTPRLL